VFTMDIGVDLGTANTLVHVAGKGIVLREPSVVAINRDTKQVLAVGDEAKLMLGRTPGNIVATRPVRNGVIGDFDVTQAMLKYFFRKTMRNRSPFTRPRVIICVPSGVTAVEERSVREAAINAGAKEAYLIEEPMAAAIGSGLPVAEPTGNMIVDIGGGTTEVAIISLSGIVTVNSVRVAGDEMDDSITNFVKKNFNLAIGEQTAEEIKIAIGSAYLERGQEQNTYEVRGRDLISGLPKTIQVTAKEINTALMEPVSSIVEAVKGCLETAPPELAADIMDRGIIMAGGGSLLKGLPTLITKETNIVVHLAEDPLDAVVKGTGKVLENIDILRKIQGNYHRNKR